MSIDKQILENLKGGRTDALEKLYTMYSGRVYNFILSMIKDSALSKDIAQDVFIQIWEKRDNIRVGDNFEGYLFTITRNLVYLHIRRQVLMHNYINQLDEADSIKVSNIEENLDTQIFEEQISKLIVDLPEARRQIFLLYWKSGYSYKEIAESLNISDKTVATQMQRSFKFLREKLGAIIFLLAFGNASNLL